MEDRFKLINPEEIKDNVFKLIGSDWMLITAGTIGNCNTMTASWGGMGVLWGYKVAFCFVRPDRYTYRFMEDNDKFTLSFFDEKYKDSLQFCGSHSGRNIDKIKSCGFTAIEKDGTVSFNEARLVLICNKIYHKDFDPANFLITEIGENYPKNDYHRMYIGKIDAVLIKATIF